MQQLALLDMRPICVGCKQPTDMLGQWSPGNKTYLCKMCSLAHPAPMDAFEPTDNRLGVGLRREDEYDAQRTYNVHMENVLHRLRGGCQLALTDADPDKGLPCEAHDYPAELACRLCVKDLKRYSRRVIRGVPEQFAVLRFRSHMKESIYNRTSTAKFTQESLPFCKRCGAVHNHRYQKLSGYREMCESCHHQTEAETIWRMRAIFAGRDDEDILDTIQKSHPQLFEMGILPDFWFKMKLKEEQP